MAETLTFPQPVRERTLLANRPHPQRDPGYIPWVDNVIPLRRKAVRRPEPLWREALGEQLRRERRDRGDRITDVAERAGVSPQYLSELERGRKDPSSEILAAVSGALGLSVHELTRRAGGHLSGPVCLAA